MHHHDLCLHVLGLGVSVNTSKAFIREVRGISLTITSTAWSRIVRELRIAVYWYPSSRDPVFRNCRVAVRQLWWASIKRPPTSIISGQLKHTNDLRSSFLGSDDISGLYKSRWLLPVQFQAVDQLPPYPLKILCCPGMMSIIKESNSRSAKRVPSQQNSLEPVK